jgi:hypothetical protein
MDRAIVQQARERWAMRTEAEGAWIEYYERDTRYAAGDQWDADVLQARAAGPGGVPRVTVSMNFIAPFLANVRNGERENRAGIKVTPVDRQSDPQTAQAIEDFIRHIEYQSNAEDAYDTGGTNMTRGGKGWWRLLTDWEHEWSFAQVLKIDRIADSLSVFMDPTGRSQLDYSPARWCFVVERQSKQHLMQRYEITEPQWQGWLMDRGGWAMKDECLVADYYCKEDFPVTLVQLPGGVVRYVPQLVATEEEGDRQRQEHLLHVVVSRLAVRGIYPIQAEEVPALQGGQARTRQSWIPVVWWYKINGHTILEQTLWPGSRIPVIPVLGEEFILDGVTDYQGLARNLIGAQDQLNYARSLTIETIAQGPKNPWIGPAGAFDGHPEWDTANFIPYSKLEYNSLDVNGLPVPPPFRMNAEPAIQATSMLAQQTSQDFYALTGMPPALLGEQTNEVSGVAIRRRQAQGALNVAHYPHQMRRAQRNTWQQCLEVIPIIYHEPGRVARILGEDMQPSLIQLQPGRGAPQTAPIPAQQYADGTRVPEQPLPEGIAGIYDFTAGTYDVIIQSGPNFQTQQEEAAQRLLELAQVSPKVADLGAHILAGTQTFRRSDELERLLKKALPPGFLDEQDAQKPEEKVVVLEAKLNQMQAMGQQMQAQMQQMGQAYQQMQQENSQLKLRLEAKHADAQLEAQDLADQRRVDQEKLHLERERFEFEKLKWQHEQEWRRYQAEVEQQQADNEGGEPKEAAG